MSLLNRLLKNVFQWAQAERKQSGFQQPVVPAVVLRRFHALTAAGLLIAFVLLQSPGVRADDVGPESTACAQWLDHRLGKLNSSEQLDLCTLTAGRPVLIVNTASFCGFTPQFEGLEALYQTYRDAGLVVLGFPSNDFFQEADAAAETAEICFINYGVTFPMTEQVSVKGGEAHPIFRHLADTGQPRWNFNKYLISRSGEVIAHFDSSVEPDSVQLLSAIQSQL